MIISIAVSIKTGSLWNMEDITGHLILVMGPSGSGKGRLVNALGSLVNDIYFAQTYTTRQRRDGARENKKYVFVTEDEFKKAINKGEFIEWAEFSGNFYGTPASEILKPLQEGKVVLKEMDLQGIQQIKKIIPEDNITVVYVDAGDWSSLQRRIKGRAAISKEELELRRLRYLEESKSKDFADVVILNKDGYVKNAVYAFRSLIKNILKKTNGAF